MFEGKAIIDYNGLKTTLSCSIDETMDDILKNYGNKIQKNINELYFFYDGKEIDKEKKFKEVLNDIDRERKEMKISTFNMNYNMNCNYIIGEIEIKEENIGQDTRIINTYQEAKRKEELMGDEDDYIHENDESEEELKNTCEIKINNNKISFNYFHKFDQKGKYIV